MDSTTTHSKSSQRAQLRSFVLLMGGVFLVIALWPFLLRGETIQMWAGFVAALFGVPSLACPSCLEPVHRSWMKIGEKLGWINSRIILGIMYFGVFTPMALIIRLLGKRPLQLHYDPDADIYRVPKHTRDPKHVLKSFLGRMTL